MAVSRSIGFWLGIAISTICLYLSIALIDAAELPVLAGRIDWLMVVLCGLATVASILARIRRWHWMLPDNTRLSAAFSASGIGFLFTNLLPMRLGDAARLFVIARSEGISGWQSGASIVIERFLDVAICVAIILVLAPLVAIPDDILDPVLGVLAAVLVTTIAVACFALWVRRGRHLPALIRRPVEEIIASLGLLGTKGRLAPLILWTAAVWILALARQWFGLAAFVSDPTLIEAAFLTAMLNLSMALPSAPASVGVFHYAGQLALTVPFAAKYSPTAGLGIATLLHLHYFLITMLVGVLGLWLLQRTAGERWTWSGLRNGIARGARSALDGVRERDRDGDD